MFKEANGLAEGDVLRTKGGVGGGGGIVADIVTVNDAKAQGDVCGSEGGD